MSERLDKFESVIGYRFHDRTWLDQARTHSSAVGADMAKRSNERLEFLGDRVLGLVVAELLFESYPDEPEGALARRHTALVRRETLARVATEIGVADFLTLVQPDAAGDVQAHAGILADACEALIGAIFLDGGLQGAQAFVRGKWTPLMNEDLSPPQDAKTALQEWSQARSSALPEYVEVDRSGPAHAPVFTIEVRLPGLKPEQGEGPNKRGAEQAAAAAMLEQAKSKA